jgi:hypothetical protein
MRRIAAILLIGLIIVSCALVQPLPSRESLIQTGVVQTRIAKANLPTPEIKTTTDFTPPDQQLRLTPIQTEVLTSTTVPTGTEISTPIPGIGMEAKCGDAFLANITNPPELTKDLFEHHAHGIFLIILLEMSNTTNQPIQIWDGDYQIIANLANTPVFYSPQKAATGYLFIVRGNNLHQDLIKPGGHWRTYLAFDIDPRSENWVLVVKPGNEIGNPVCKLQIRLGN